MRENAKTPERHAQRMAAKQKIMNERIARADKEQGILLVLTGPGKGKSSSGFGMLARALGHGMKVGVVQFIKGAFSTGEEAFFRNLPNVDYHVMGEGYTGTPRTANATSPPPTPPGHKPSACCKTTATTWYCSTNSTSPCATSTSTWTRSSTTCKPALPCNTPSSPAATPPTPHRPRRHRHRNESRQTRLQRPRHQSPKRHRALK